MSKVDPRISSAEKIMMKRYAFLYENSNFILAQILYEHRKYLKEMCDDITRVTGIYLDYFDNELHYKRTGDFVNHLSMFQLIEEYMFGDYHGHKTELERILLEMRIHTEKYSHIKNHFWFYDDKRTHFKDTTTQVLLELMRDFVKNQGTNTVVVERGIGGLHYYGGNSTFTVSVADLKEKVRTIDKYLDINSFRNNSNQNRQRLLSSSHKFPVISNKTLVISNNFLYDTRSLVFDENNESVRDFYFSCHDEIPFDLEGICRETKDDIERVVIKPCKENFRINEDAIFYAKDSYLQMCSRCGYIVNVSDSLDNEEVKRRIRNRYIYDQNILYKNNKLSELVSLGGVNDFKRLVKSRNGGN